MKIIDSVVKWFNREKCFICEKAIDDSDDVELVYGNDGEKIGSVRICNQCFETYANDVKNN